MSAQVFPIVGSSFTVPNPLPTNVTQWDSTTLTAPPTAWGTAPSGTVIGGNVEMFARNSALYADNYGLLVSIAAGTVLFPATPNVWIEGSTGVALDAAPGAVAPTNALQIAGADTAGKTRVIATDLVGNVDVTARATLPTIVQKTNGFLTLSVNLTVTGASFSTPNLTLTGAWGGGAANAYMGSYFSCTGFTGTSAPNNGIYLCTASSAGSITLTNVNGFAGFAGSPVALQGLTIAFGSNVKAGNSIVVTGGNIAANLNMFVVDSLNNAYICAAAVNGSATNAGTFYASQIPAGGADSVTLFGGASALAAEIYEVANLGNLVVTTQNGSTSAAPTSGSIPIPQPGCLGFWGFAVGAGTISQSTPPSPSNVSFDSGNIATSGTGLVNFGAFSAYPSGKLGAIGGVATGVSASFNVTCLLSASVAWEVSGAVFAPTALQIIGTIVGSSTNATVPVVNNVVDSDSLSNTVAGFVEGLAGAVKAVQVAPRLFNGATWDRQRSAQLPTTMYTTNVAQTNVGVASVGVLSGPAGSAVQSKNTATAGAVALIAAAMTNSPSKGNSIVVVCAVGNASTPTIADTIATSYKLVSSQLGPSSAFGVYIFYGIVPASAANTVTVTNGGSAASMGIEVYEINGLLAIPAQQPDQTAVGVNTGTAAATPALNPQYANEICFAGVGVGTTAETITPAAGWINDSTTQTGTSGLFSFASLSQFVPDFQSVIPAATIGASKPWAMAAVSFRPIALGVADQNNTCVDLVTGDAQTLNVAQTYNGVTQINRHNRGAIITVEIGTVSGTSPTLTLQLQWSPDNGATWLNFGGPITGLTTLISNTTGAFVVYPSLLTGLTTGATLTTLVAAPLPRTWRITYTVGGTGTPTFPITSFVNYAL
jgi:hypothetical protein